jgi:tRNA(Arg) A34 adenosine deaminase TadA
MTAMSDPFDARQSTEAPATLVARYLDVIQQDIVPLTAAGVARGNKIFGAAILRKTDLSLVLAETNNELENPLWHGEMHAMKRFYELPAASRPATAECLFLSTHEPCSLCLSAITWAGFDNFTYLFSHEDSRDAFAIPHDLRILKEVFGLAPGGYRAENAFWRSACLRRLAAALAPAEAAAATARLAALDHVYAGLSAQYQAGKEGNAIPLN